MRKVKRGFIFLLIAGMFIFTGQSNLYGLGGGAVPWDVIEINRAPQGWVVYRDGELSVLFGRFDASAAFEGTDGLCPSAQLVTKMSFALKLKVNEIQQAYSQVRDVVICHDNFLGQWEEAKYFINEVVINGICGSPGVWGPPDMDGNWVVTKLVRPAASSDAFMAEINLAVKCSP